MHSQQTISTWSGIFWVEQIKTLKGILLKAEVGILALVIGGLQILLWIAMLMMPGTVATAQQVGSTAAASNAAAQTAEVVNELHAMVVWPGALVNVLSFSSSAGLGSLMVIILVGAVVAQEYQWRTVHLVLGRGVSRLAYGLARFASLLLPIFLMVGGALCAGGLISLVTSLGVDGSLHLEQIHLGQFLLSILRTAYSLLPYAALAMLLAVFSRSVVVAIGGGLAFALIFEGLITQLLALIGGPAAQIVQYLPVALTHSVLSLNQAMIQGTAVAQKATEMPMLAPTPAAIGVALYTLVFLALACWRMQKQDLTA